jgi:hypothetical protein
MSATGNAARSSSNTLLVDRQLATRRISTPGIFMGR